MGRNNVRYVVVTISEDNGKPTVHGTYKDVESAAAQRSRLYAAVERKNEWVSAWVVPIESGPIRVSDYI